MMGVLWEGRMWRSRGNWDGLNTLVLLQTDWDSLQQEGRCRAGLCSGREQLSAWHASFCWSRFGAMLCVPPSGSQGMEEPDGVAQS